MLNKQQSNKDALAKTEEFPFNPDLKIMQETGVKYEGQIRERGLYVMDHPSLCALLIRQTVLGPMGPEIHSYCFERNELGTLDIIISISKSGLPENVSEKRSAYL